MSDTVTLLAAVVPATITALGVAVSAGGSQSRALKEIEFAEKVHALYPDDQPLKDDVREVIAARAAALRRPEVAALWTVCAYVVAPLLVLLLLLDILATQGSPPLLLDLAPILDSLFAGLYIFLALLMSCVLLVLVFDRAKRRDKKVIPFVIRPKAKTRAEVDVRSLKAESEGKS